MRGKAPALLATAALVVAAHGGVDLAEASGDAVSIRYQLWDANQLPAYEACAAAFTEANPNITIEIEQLGWDDYWTGITTGFVSGTAPDVFTDHLNFYPEFAETEQILPYNELVERDGVDTSIYVPGLLELWQDPDGNQYGLPKDWDTVALVVNNDMLAESGVDPATLGELTWNPEDGGTFEELIAALSIDANGVRGNEEGFDPSERGDVRLRLCRCGRRLWPDRVELAGPDQRVRVHERAGVGHRVQLRRSLIGRHDRLGQRRHREGLRPALRGVRHDRHNDLFKAGQTATTSLGSWEINDVVAAEFETTFFPTPIGPSGERASIMNGLADSISASTEHPDEAWEWVKFLASPECQNLVAEKGVVFPAIPEAAATVEAVRAEQGVDVSAFTVHVEEGTTYLSPIADYAADRNAIMMPAMEAVFTGSDTAETLGEANSEVNDLF